MQQRNDPYSSENIKAYNAKIYPKRRKYVVSILNFDRQSPDVNFTEPATIEAIKQLGFEMSEFNFRPLDSFGASDIDIRDKLFQKFLRRRQNLIDQTVRKRKEILEAEKQANSSSIPKQPSPKPSNQLEEFEQKSNNSLRKLALNRLHNLMCYQNDSEINARLNEKFRTINEQQKITSEMISNFRETSDSPRQTKQFKSTLKASNTQQIDDDQTSNYSLSKRKPQIQDELRPTNFHEAQMAQAEKLHRAHLAREERTKRVLERRASIERENHAQLAKRIQEKENRFNLSSQNRKRVVNEQLESKGQIYRYRSQSARRRRDDYDDQKQQQTYESYMIQQIRTEERMKEINHQKQYNTTMFKCKQEEHLQKVKHSQNAKNYSDEKYRQQLKNDRVAAQNEQREKEMVKNQMMQANLLMKNRRDKINKAFDELQGFDDDVRMSQIQKLMGYDDQQMRDLISTAAGISQKTPHNRKV